jgi:hypothetical protein
MRRYEAREQTVVREVEVEARCDGCGIAEAETEWRRLMPVAIEVDPGEEFGRRDEYDYCDPCLIERADVLKAAGSRSELVGGLPPDDEEPADG